MFQLAIHRPARRKARWDFRVELIRNGQIVRHWDLSTKETTITHTLAESENCWYIVRAFGSDQKWQVALTSPICFAAQSVPRKRPPLTTLVRGRIYDFVTGQDRAGKVEIRRYGATLKRFSASSVFLM